MSEWVPDDANFALLLTHDVDRPYKTYQSMYYALRDRDPSHLQGLVPGVNPYWTFDEIRAIERELGVRSAFYFLDEQSLGADRPATDWVSPRAWRLFAGRYDLDDPDVRSLIVDLDRAGWEVGLHGSYEAYDDRARLGTEKDRLESILGHEVTGGRQHYLNLERPQTWCHQQALGMAYDATPGSSSEYGFQDGYDPFRPFDDEFVVFPLTLMECALPDPERDFEAAWGVCRDLLTEALENEAVMSILWHPRYFSDDYEGYAELYRRTIRMAQRLGAWVGTPGELYAQAPPAPSVTSVSDGVAVDETSGIGEMADEAVTADEATATDGSGATPESE